MSLTSLLVSTYRNMLGTLSALLDKAEQQMPDSAQTLLSARLADDMFPLANQIRFAAYQAQDAVYRLRGEAVPESVQAVAAAARNGGAAPGTIADARARLNEALAFLDTLAKDALDDRADAQLAVDLPNGIVFDMTGESFVRDWALPQFYFHVVTAYAILRSHGVEIGKADFVPHMFAYLRPGTAPAG